MSSVTSNPLAGVAGYEAEDGMWSMRSAEFVDTVGNVVRCGGFPVGTTAPISSAAAV
jgi:hypothetical protein